jgi:hypothetical protein
MRSALFILATLLLLAPPPSFAAEGRVELNLTTAEGAPITGPQQWLPLLDAAGFSSTRISNEVPEKPLDIVQGGTAASPIYTVHGVLTAGGEVMLPPGRKFSQRDKAALKQWVERLKSQGPLAASGVKLPFGLTKDQFESTRKEFAAAVTATTRGTDPAATLTALTGQFAAPVAIDDNARQALAESGAVRDELQGLATGTALAALVRPAGLVLRPRFNNGKVEYQIADSRSEGDHWPIGWASKEPRGQLVPKLLENDETQDAEVPLAAALGELQGRIGVPFVIDYNSLAAAGIDLAESKVKMKAGQRSYDRILSGLLMQAKLKYEARQDDSGKPFLWIGTIR